MGTRIQETRIVMPREYLEKLRTGLGLRQVDVAKRCGVCTSTYCMLEKGTGSADLRISSINMLAKAFGVPGEKLYHLESEYQSQLRAFSST